MLVSAFAKPVIAPKKLVTNTRARTVTDHDILISGVPISFSSAVKETPVEIKNRLSSHKIFTITFNYLEQVYHTKVLKVTYSGNQPLYKVALSSSISNSTPICWLQHQPQGWTMPLGQELDERLKQAITLAIGCQEF
jgi:hypothetical protein